jgi:hypothetical protein
MLQSKLACLESGVVFPDICDMKRGQLVLKTHLEEITILESCLSRNADNSTAVNTVPLYQLRHKNGQQPEILKCFHSTQYYDHSAQWMSTTDNCTMCNCNHDVTKCDAILCLDFSCASVCSMPCVCCQSCTNVTALN